MHILLIHQAFAAIDEPGGTRHHEFARYLVAQGHRVTVIASPVSYLTGALTPHPSPDGRGEGVRVIRAKVYEAHHKSFMHRVLAFFSFMLSSFWIGLGVDRVDVVWGTSPPIFQGVTAWALARIKGAKFLFEVRDLWPQFAIAVGVLTNPTLIKLSEGLERFLYSHADQVMVNSPGYSAHVQRRGSKKVELIPNGADPEMFDPLANGIAFRQKNKLKNKFVILYAGAHGMSNDLDVVLGAAKILEKERDIHFVFVGDGKEKQNLIAHAESLGLKNVLFLPPVPKSAMGAVLAGADACLAILKPIDEYKTTYPNKVFDYMAAGRPVILAIDGVIREVIDAAQCGVFAQPGNAQAIADAARQFESNRDRSLAMGLAGRKFLEENFSREAIAGKLLKVMEKMR